MSKLYAEIKKKIADFELNMLIESDAGRIGILGASGSGKSMTLRSIAGIEEIDSGHIEINGRVVYDSSEKINVKPQQRNVGYMFQNYALFPTMNVMQNVMAGLKESKAENESKALDMIARFGLSGLEKRLPGELSGGQQQRVALARIMVTEPGLILLDEPFSALDGYLRDRMQMEMADMLADYEGQVIMVSHSRDELYRFSDELFVIKSGEVMTKGETASVFKDPGRIETARLTGCKNFSKALVTGENDLKVIEWGIDIHAEKPVPDSTTYIGYRAHHFEPVWGDKTDNCIPFDLVKVDELPFERNYYLRPANPVNENDIICWFVQSDIQQQIEEKGLPDYLRLREEDILFLK